MADTPLTDRQIAFLFTDGVEEIEYTDPRDGMQALGARTTLVSPKAKGDTVQGYNHLTPSERFRVEVPAAEARVEDYDALVIPGGVANPDRMRMSESAVHFVRRFAESGKPLAAICHAPWMLVEADLVDGRRLTSWPSLETDIRNAGGDWVDQEVVVDGNIITSRGPDDLPAFRRALQHALESV